MSPEQIFSLLMLIVAVLAVALVVGSVRPHWRNLCAGLRPDGAEVSASWFRPLVRG